MIGNRHDVKFDISRDAKWILCAILDKEYLQDVSLFCQGTTDFEKYITI